MEIQQICVCTKRAAYSVFRLFARRRAQADYSPFTIYPSTRGVHPADSGARSGRRDSLRASSSHFALDYLLFTIYYSPTATQP